MENLLRPVHPKDGSSIQVPSRMEAFFGNLVSLEIFPGNAWGKECEISGFWLLACRWETLLSEHIQNWGRGIVIAISVFWSDVAGKKTQKHLSVGKPQIDCGNLDWADSCQPFWMKTKPLL